MKDCGWMLCKATIRSHAAQTGEPGGIMHLWGDMMETKATWASSHDPGRCDSGAFPY